MERRKEPPYPKRIKEKSGKGVVMGKRKAEPVEK